MNNYIIYGCLFILGLCLGSFLNVVIYRWSKGLSIFKPLFSICPKCKKTLKWYHNIPLFSYIFLKGKCAYCKASISIKYPLIELLTASLFVYSYFYFKPSFGWITFFGFSFYVLMLIPISFIDLEIKEIPDKLSLGLILAGWIFSLTKFNPLVDFGMSLLSGLSGIGLLFLINEFYYHFTGKEGIGMGDFKLMGAIGAFLGYKSFYTVLVIASVVGVLVFLGVNLYYKVKKQNQKILDLQTEIPFGPFLALGSLFYLFNWIRLPLF